MLFGQEQIYIMSFKSERWFISLKFFTKHFVHHTLKLKSLFALLNVNFFLYFELFKLLVNDVVLWSVKHKGRLLCGVEKRQQVIYWTKCLHGIHFVLDEVSL